jgi:glycosyltransferase involved in cell wall biosynthesis
VKFLGHVNDPRHVIELHCNAFAYIHGHEFGGINPALLKALGCGNLVLANDTPFSREVLDNGSYGILFKKDTQSVEEAIRHAESHHDEVVSFRKKARTRITERFTWEAITAQYEQLFQSLVKKLHKPGGTV